MAEDLGKGKRISSDQRLAMLEFMKDHPSVATGKFTAPDGAKPKQLLLEDLATLLNSMPNGVRKSGDKWLKSWQDWKCDTKAKAALLKRERRKIGGGKGVPKAKPLTDLEDKLLEFLGPNIVFGHQQIPDTLVSEQEQSAQSEGGHVEVMRCQNVDGTGEMDILSIPIDSSISLSPPRAPGTFISSSESSNLSPPVATLNPSSPQGSSSVASTASLLSAETSSKKRRRSNSTNEEEDALLLVTKMHYDSQKEATMERNALEKERLALEREKLELEKERNCLLKHALTAFAGAMTAMECFYRGKVSGRSEIDERQ